MKVQQQKGLTLLGFLIVLAIGLFFAYAGMRVIPMYLEYHALTGAMESLKDEPNARNLPATRIKRKIEDSLWASYASNNIRREHMRVSKKSDGMHVRVAYEVRTPFIGNISIVGTFENTVVLR